MRQLLRGLSALAIALIPAIFTSGAAVQQVPYGTVRNVDGEVTLVNVKYYPPELISPPDGMKSVDGIRSEFKRP